MPDVCQTLQMMDGTTVHVLRSIGLIEKAIRKRGRWKWCYNCRKRLRHMLTMLYDPNPSYYDPIIFWKCGGCGKDYTNFPGY